MKQATSNKSFNKSVISTAVSAAIVMSMSSISATAAETADAEKGKIERIEVTANRRSQSIQDVPYNISAVSGDELDGANIIDASDMMRGIAGITVVDRGYRNSGAVSGVIIRGVNVDGGSNGDVALSAVPTVASYINDTPIYANFILKDIEMVEVLRGPQGTLYGSGSLAGTVKYRMNKPETDEFYGSVSSSFGQTDGSDGNNFTSDVMVNIPLSDNIAFRSNVGKIDNDGIIDYSNVYQLDSNNYAPVATNNDTANGSPVFKSVKDADTVDITYGRVSLYVEASDSLNLLLSHQFQQDEIGGRRQITRGTHWTEGSEQNYGDYENGAVQLEPSERDVSLTALEVEWNLGFATLTSSSSIYDHEGSSTSDNTGFYAQNNWFDAFYGGSPRPLAKANRGYKEEAFVQEVRLVSNETINNIDWVVGAYYMDQDTLSTQESYMPGWVEWGNAAQPTIYGGGWDILGTWGMEYTDNDFLYKRNQNFKDTAFFGELTYHFSNKMRATIGARNFNNEFTNDTGLTLPIWPPGDEAYFDTDESKTLYKANLSYDISDDTMVYGTFAQGYRRGGANAVPLEGGFRESELWQQYGSDSIDNYEIGLKGYLSDGAHSYTVSAFVMDWQDPQLNTSTPDWGFFAVANGESAKTTGIELELQGYLTDDLHYALGYAYVQAELTADFSAPAAWWADDDTAVVAEDGTRLPATPENTLSISLDYTYSMDNSMYWITQVNGYYQSDSVNALGEGKYQGDIDAFSIWNLSTRISSDDWDVTLYVKNVLNEDGITGLVPESAMGTDPDENFLGNSSKDYISLPRTIGLSATYRF